MDFSWSDLQDELYRETLRFSHEHLNDSAAERDASHRFGQVEWARCGEFGLLGLCAPEAYEGRGLDALTTAHVMEALGRGCEDTGLLFSMSAHLFACLQPIAQYGQPEIKANLLPELASGRLAGCNAITEPEAGSDAFALRTRATPDGHEYILNGEKSFVSNGSLMGVAVVYAMQNPRHGYLGISAFAVELNRPGVTIGPPAPKIGLTTSPMNTLYLEDCRVPETHLLGRAGQGVRIFNHSMAWERACLFALYLGVMDRQLARTVEYAKARRQFGRPIAKHQAVAHRIAEMKLRLEAARWLLYRACWSVGAQPEDVDLATALSKIAVTRAALQNGLDAIHLHGAMGIVGATGIERILRDAVPSTLFSGTTEMQLDRIARGLGL